MCDSVLQSPRNSIKDPSTAPPFDKSTLPMFPHFLRMNVMRRHPFRRFALIGITSGALSVAALPPSKAEANPGSAEASETKAWLGVQMERQNLSGLPGVSIQRAVPGSPRSEEHTSEIQSRGHLVCRLLL